MTKNKTLELYFHIPFCVRKCLYCDFLSAPNTLEVQRAYMKALCIEAKERAAEYAEYTVVSIFIGGGTPSLVESKGIEQLMEVVHKHYVLAADVEISIEMNPGTVDKEKLLAYRRAGINRLSIGLQSANDEELKQLGRIHTYEEFLATYENAVECGFSNINVDIMSALPGQTLDSYVSGLQKVLALKLSPKHISAYSLIVEEGTPFYQMDEKGELELPDEDTERVMYQETARLLAEAGLERYEISNYAVKGYECRHNCGYWQRVNYVGFGIGAASMVENTRFANDTDLEAYICEPTKQRSQLQKLTLQEQMEETLFLGLRMAEGVSFQIFAECFGQSMEEVYGSVIEKNIVDGLLTIRGEDSNKRLLLTSKGMDVSNYVMAQFLLD